MYIRRFLLLFLSISVLSSPLFLLDDTQPQLGASLTLLGNSACPQIPGYGSLLSTNVTQDGNVTIASQTTYVSAIQTGILPAINSTASIVAPPSIGVSKRTCTKIKEATLFDYKPSNYDFPLALLSPNDNRYFAFAFVRTGGQELQITIFGRPQDSPDRPGSYIPFANELFIAGNLENFVYFSIAKPMWVKIHLRIYSRDSGPFTYQLQLFQIDVVA